MLWLIVSTIWLCLLLAALIGFIVGWTLRGKPHRDNRIVRSDSSHIALQLRRSAEEIAAAPHHAEAPRGDTQSLTKKVVPSEAPFTEREAESHSLQDANVISVVETTRPKRLAQPKPKTGKQRKLVKDDLKLIAGIGPVLERRLNKLAVYRFKQIAHWTKDDIERFAHLLHSFGDRITREHWKESAAKLHLGKYKQRL